MTREIPVSEIQRAVESLIVRSAYELPQDYLEALAQARAQEASTVGRQIIGMLQENAAFAELERVPTCQDTGMAVLLLEVGQQVIFTGGDLGEALTAGVKAGYAGLRKSVVSDPLTRVNSGDNTPPVVHYEIVPGRDVRLTVMMKGFGAEMMSRLRMLPPAAGLEGVKQFVVETVERAGPNACPPVIVGVGLGSTFEGVAMLAKKALLRPIGRPNPATHIAQLERDLMSEINSLGIGPQGLGGNSTALAVHVEQGATHIAALPVAVNLNCSAPRRARVVI